MEPAKWESVVAEAAKAFARFGFKKTSMDEIARAARVAKGTLYLGCKSKRDLFYQAILRDQRLWHAELAKSIDPRVPADELLIRVTERALDIMDRFPLARDLTRSAFDADLPDWVDHLDELRAHGTRTVVEILQLGVRQGRFRADIDVEAVAGVFLDIVTTTIMYHARGPDAATRVARRHAAAFDVVLRGLLRERAPWPVPAQRNLG